MDESLRPSAQIGQFPFAQLQIPQDVLIFDADNEVSNQTLQMHCLFRVFIVCTLYHGLKHLLFWCSLAVFKMTHCRIRFRKPWTKQIKYSCDLTLFSVWVSLKSLILTIAASVSNRPIPCNWCPMFLVIRQSFFSSKSILKI